MVFQYLRSLIRTGTSEAKTSQRESGSGDLLLGFSTGGPDVEYD